MAYEVNFGTMRLGGSRPVPNKSGVFRLALLGDFSARAQSGKLDTGGALAERKPFKVDCDNVDALLKRFAIKLRLPLNADGSSVEVPIASMDDFHPDQLHNNLPIFSELSGLRQRLKTPSTFPKAAKEVQAWAGVKALRARKTRARGAAIPANGKLSDFARLIGAPTATPKGSTPIAELLKQAVGPYVVPAKDPRQDELVATVDAALAATMRSVLHHPDFQCVESLWRSVDLLVRRLETDQNLQIALYDVTAEEIAADLSKTDSLENSGLYKLLIERPALDAAQGPFAVVIGGYMFEQTPPHAELLGRIAKIVAQSQTAFIAGIGAGCLDTKLPDLHPLIREAWDSLAQAPESAYTALALPRFLLRMPYGERTDPIESFDFEEFTPQAGLGGMLWGNAAIIAGLLLGATFSKQGSKMQPGSVLTLGEMPFYYYTDADGDQIALPCTERMLSSKTAEFVSKHRFIPLLSIKGRPEVRLAGFGSLGGGLLAGPWKPVTKTSPEPASASSQPPEEPEAEQTTEAEQAPAAEAEESPVTGSDDNQAGEAAAQPIEPEAKQEGADSELDNLLASLSEEAAPVEEPAPTDSKSAEAEPEIDPDLAKLLKELGS
jgi:type VI secretion system protein ImpC